MQSYPQGTFSWIGRGSIPTEWHEDNGRGFILKCKFRVLIQSWELGQWLVLMTCESRDRMFPPRFLPTKESSESNLLPLFLRPNMYLSVGKPHSWRPALVWLHMHYYSSGCSINPCPLMDGLSWFIIAAGKRKCSGLQLYSQGLRGQEPPSRNLQETRICWDRSFSRSIDATGQHSGHGPRKWTGLQEKQILPLENKQ